MRRGMYSGYIWNWNGLSIYQKRDRRDLEIPWLQLLEIAIYLTKEGTSTKSINSLKNKGSGVVTVLLLRK